MSIFARLRRLEREGSTIRTAIVGAGFVGRGIVHQLNLTPGISPSVIVNRTREHAMDAFRFAGVGPDVVISDDADEISSAILERRPLITDSIDALCAAGSIDVVVDATGDVEYGAEVAQRAIATGHHVVSMNYETDATVGPWLRRMADSHGVVYSGSDGDQPGVLSRLVEYVKGLGLDVIAAVNCKGFMDIAATPDSIRPWAEKQNTSLAMTTAFTDGTKMNIENASLANATGLIPEVRGMHGVRTSLGSALDDFRDRLGMTGVVDYTLGGDFGGGVFVIGSLGEDRSMQPYLEYLKMGPGPWYLFYRPWHLVHFETAITVAEVVLDGTPTISPLPDPVAEVIAVAKRDLPVGHVLDGIGGWDYRGVVDTVERAQGLLPVGLAEGTRLTREVQRGDVIPIDACAFPVDSPLVMMWHETRTKPHSSPTESK